MTGYDQLTRIARVVALASVLAGCAPEETSPALRAAGSELESANGLLRNGLLRNGLLRNGLLRNGLLRNGLTGDGLGGDGVLHDGLLTPEFEIWFDEDPVTSDAFMTYLVRCATPAGQSYSFTSPTSGVAYTWTGSLGLAPGFASGLAPTEAEQQVVSACLAAHVNYHGRHVDMAIEGYLADGSVIPKVPNETSIYWVREAAFFGNLFVEDGAVHACRDHKEWHLGYSSARACAYDYKLLDMPSDLCAPIVYVGGCASYCTWNKRDSAHTKCTYGGRDYLPVTTRILPTDVFQCGDGVCQFTEHCGTGNTHDSCMADCGDCSTPTTGESTVATPWAKP